MEAGSPPVDSYVYFPGQTPQKRKEARDTCRLIYTMATDYEREILKSRAYEDVGAHIMACEDIVEVVRTWWRQAYLAAVMKVPDSCRERRQGSRAAYQAMCLEWVGNRKNHL